MTVEADLFNALKTLVSNRVYPDIAPNGATTPYITYQQVGGEAIAFVDNLVPSKQNGRFQINVWGTSRSAVAALALQIESAMTAASAFQARPIGAPSASHELDTGLYGSRQDWSVWSNR